MFQITHGEKPYVQCLLVGYSIYGRGDTSCLVLKFVISNELSHFLTVKRVPAGVYKTLGWSVKIQAEEIASRRLFVCLFTKWALNGKFLHLNQSVCEPWLFCLIYLFLHISTCGTDDSLFPNNVCVNDWASFSCLILFIDLWTKSQRLREWLSCLFK